MASRKQTTSKGKAINAIGGTPASIDQPHTSKNIGSFLPQTQKAVAIVQVLSLQYEDQLFQILADMKEQMNEHQAYSDRDREQAALDRDNAIHEHEH